MAAPSYWSVATDAAHFIPKIYSSNQMTNSSTVGSIPITPLFLYKKIRAFGVVVTPLEWFYLGWGVV
jgi:hypothetical protein